MIWTIWRQHRAEAGVAALILAALAAGMLVVGTTARDRADALGLPDCVGARGDCSAALDALHRDFHSIPPFIAALVAVPLLAGMFWAAPLVSREYEAGTHRLAWTQSVSPLRWITVKIAVIVSVLVAVALVLGLLATWALDPLAPAFGGRFNSTWYDTQGLVPAACMVFAFALGVAASAAIRRTIPAMAVTLVLYAAARIPVHWVRAHFWPSVTRHNATPLGVLLDNPQAPLRDDFTSRASTGDWVQSVTITDPAGHHVIADGVNLNVLANYCPDLAPTTRHGPPPPPSRADIAACRPRVVHLRLHETITYHPASHFWAIQAVESVIFLGLAALLITVAILAVTRHRPN